MSIKSFLAKLASKPDGLKISGLIEIEVIRDGKVVDKRKIKNLITTAGKGEVTNLMGNVSSPASFTYLAVGTGATAAAAGDTTLQTEITDSGLARASATVTRQTTTTTNDTLRLIKSWTVSGTKAITECGIFNAASAGVLLGRQVFTAVNVVSSDTFQVTYSVSLA
jgi:hypothetical protein